MWHDTRVSRTLGIRYPIIQGPFGGGFSAVGLVAAVSNAGGLGSFGAVGLTPAQIKATVADIRAATDKPFAINLWVSNEDDGGTNLPRPAFERAVDGLMPWFDELGVARPAYPTQFGQRFEDQLDALLATRPPVFSFIYGIPSREVLQECRKHGVLTLGGAITPDEAVALDDAGVDLIIASGAEAGGHRFAFLREAERSLIGTFSLIPQAVDRVKVPVIAAGGIADVRGMKAAFALGAEGVLLGTAFLACDESNAEPLHKAKLFSPEARYTGLTRAYTGRLARSLENRLMLEADAQGLEPAPYPAQGWLLSQLRRAGIEQGRTDLMSLWAGQSASLVTHRSATALMAALVQGMES